MELQANRLLALADPHTLERFKGSYDVVRLSQGQPIHEPMERIDHVYFLTDGLSSEIATDDSGRRIEVG